MHMGYHLRDLKRADVVRVRCRQSVSAVFACDARHHYIDRFLSRSDYLPINYAALRLFCDRATKRALCTTVAL